MTVAIRTPYPNTIGPSRVMVFVDGENLAIRYGDQLGTQQPLPHVSYQPRLFVWSKLLNMEGHVTCNTVRRHYYTATGGSDEQIAAARDSLSALGIEAPRVFRKHKQRGSKQVDISLAVDMLTHAHRKNYDLAVLVAGDEDYVPLVEAVVAEGRRVCLWFLENGLSPLLKNAADYFFDVGSNVLFRANAERYF